MRRGDRDLSGSFLGRVLSLGTRPPALTVFAILQAGILVSLGIGHLATRTAPGIQNAAPPAGDFGAFFTGGALVREGRGTDLYDLSVQHAAQQDHLGVSQPFWQPYLNPPALAMALAPTTGLGLVASFRIFALANLFGLLAALTYLSRAIQGVRGCRFGTATVLFLTVAYLPLATTIFGGQNTALTLALLASTYAAVRLDHTVLAGVFLGFLTYKPQYALVVGAVLLLQRQYVAVAISALIAGIHYGLGAMACGPAWPLDYMAMLAEHMPQEMAQNGQWHISLPAVVGRLLPGMGSKLVATGGALAILFILAKRSLSISPGSHRHPALFGMAVVASMLLSPHLQYYDLGILALPGILGIETLLSGSQAPSLGLKALLVAGYLCYPAWQLSEFLGVQPLFFVLLAAFVWLWKLTAR